MSRRSRHASPYGNGNRYRDPYDAVEEVDDYYYREDRPRHSSSRRAVSPGDRPRPSSTRRPRQDHSYDDYYYQEPLASTVDRAATRVTSPPPTAVAARAPCVV
ncbi:hypothetical protein AGDE_16504 [Angomonas deanei]|uniref:Uncharacterized protein n=1 Tax=Angomonas deanei TaxID=59799 RepID=A0A7G2C5D1_9TRYP|nr:hypothetical protein AGDE_16504 [Angomonas deanei]CAD2214364.1 hypothetical protein, conserved [Angomonas deanei]|eukprot:EPY16995.1 hypothetical protein AGDE_16504 [Angomonas deanei]